MEEIDKVKLDLVLEKYTFVEILEYIIEFLQDEKKRINNEFNQKGEDYGNGYVILEIDEEHPHEVLTARAGNVKKLMEKYSSTMVGLFDYYRVKNYKATLFNGENKD